MINLPDQKRIFVLFSSSLMQYIEKISFEAYNESDYLIKAVKRFRERAGHYPKCVLADQICRTYENQKYCKDHGNRLSGPKLGVLIRKSVLP